MIGHDTKSVLAAGAERAGVVTQDWDRLHTSPGKVLPCEREICGEEICKQEPRTLRKNHEPRPRTLETLCDRIKPPRALHRPEQIIASMLRHALLVLATLAASASAFAPGAALPAMRRAAVSSPACATRMAKVDLLERVETLKLLSALSNAGVLTKIERSGLLSKLEASGALSAAEKFLPLLDEQKALSRTYRSPFRSTSLSRASPLLFVLQRCRSRKQIACDPVLTTEQARQ
jgi:hypothetical protein